MEFSEKYVKLLNIENMSLTFNTPHESPSNRPYAKRIPPQVPSFDTTSDVSLQIIPYSTNILVNTHHIDNSPPKFDPPPPSSNKPITIQSFTSHWPHQYKTPSNTPP